MAHLQKHHFSYIHQNPTASGLRIYSRPDMFVPQKKANVTPAIMKKVLVAVTKRHDQTSIHILTMYITGIIALGFFLLQLA